MKRHPRPEHPRPQFVRKTWRSLNGEWEFEIDRANSGIDRDLQNSPAFSGRILVPFCPESALSGVGDKDFLNAVWYARRFDLSEAELSGRVLLHFGAVDYKTEVWVNGVSVGTHRGGYASFTFDITDAAVVGGNRVVVCAFDDNRSAEQPCGKQSRRYFSHTCDYTRTTGIWQTVWLEFVPDVYLRSVRVDATDLGGTVGLVTKLNRYQAGLTLCVGVGLHGKRIAKKYFELSGTVTRQAFSIGTVAHWSPEHPELYDITFTLSDNGKQIDRVSSYFGIRRIDLDGNRVLLNGKPVFQRLILDQGFYPDGIYTAPDDSAIVRDIELALALGYNGARLHQKVFEERYLYHADRLGYLVWGEYGSWGLDYGNAEPLGAFLSEWEECVDRDCNHPSLIGWCPYNEVWSGGKVAFDCIAILAQTTKQLDPTRPVIDASGGYHTALTDIYDTHNYEQDPTAFAAQYAEQTSAHVCENPRLTNACYAGQPYFVSEYGGIKWNGAQDPDDVRVAWGYGDGPRTIEEFCDRFCRLTHTLLTSPNIAGFCYTQLTDVEQEQNGLYAYDRSKKFPDEIYAAIRKANLEKALIEE